MYHLSHDSPKNQDLSMNIKTNRVLIFHLFPGFLQLLLQKKKNHFKFCLLKKLERHKWLQNFVVYSRETGKA